MTQQLNWTVSQQTEQHNSSMSKSGAEQEMLCAFLQSPDILAQMDVICIGTVGSAGAAILAEEKQEALAEKFSPKFLRQAKQNAQDVEACREIISEAAVADESDECGLTQLGSGGIFQGLWNLAEAAGVGLEIVLSQIPIKQETIEICNFYLVNPYELQSAGCYLMLSRQGYRTVARLQKLGICANVIGMTMDNKDRVVLYDGERRFLVKRYRDAIEQIQRKERKHK
ncbi:MAG: hypothetical protein K6G23_10260 [Lachnospiraceae bacterium]|nr:hypothetical protein [Lachnospiraceae bacterium]